MNRQYSNNNRRVRWRWLWLHRNNRKGRNRRHDPTRRQRLPLQDLDTDRDRTVQTPEQRPNRPLKPKSHGKAATTQTKREPIGVFVVFVVIVVFGLRLCVVFGLLALWILGSLVICHDDQYHYHITLCANKKYERSKTALMKAAFPEMSRVTFVFSFNLINQKLQIADR